MKLQIAKNTNEELERFVEAQRRLAEAQQAYDEIKDRLIEKMTREQRKSYTLDDGGKRYKVTYVQSMRTQIDEAGLKKAMGAVPFRKICKQVIDRKALEQALDAQTVDPAIVGQYVKEVPSAPFIRFTEGAVPDESAHDAE